MDTTKPTPALQSSATKQPATPSPFTQPTDRGALMLARSIALQESSKDGQTPNYTASGDAGTSYGAYQWNNGKKPLQPGQLPVNFTNAAKEFGLDSTDFSPVNQDKVAYAQVLKMKNQGLQPEQIAAAWNAGMGHINDWQTHKGTTEINGQQIQYDTPGYVGKVHNYYQQLSQNAPQQDQQPDLNQQTTPEDPSLGGFAKNVVQSGANFVGNIGNALLHPIDTVQNIGGAVVGGVQELGGQDNENTQKFDNLVGFFKERYGSVDKLLHTAYTDPVSVVADLSTILGVGGGLVGIAGKSAEVSGLAEASNVAGDVSRGLAKASELTNPLTPVIKGVGALASKSEGLATSVASKLTGLPSNDISTIAKNAEEFTSEKIANSSRASLASEIDNGLQMKIAEKGDTGAGYNPYKETPTLITTTPDSLDNIIRDSLKVNVTDGVIKPTSTSLLRNQSDITKLQGIYNTYKADFLNNSMDSEKFLNLRTDLGKIAYNDLGIKNTDVASAAEDVRNSLNNTYRNQIQGLLEKDAEFSAQSKELKLLRKGLIDKDGNLLDSAINKVANATGKGKDQLLARLEEISPGITKKIEIQHAMESIAGMNENKVGTYTKSIVEGGGILAGISTGNIGLVVGSITTMILASPKIAVPLIRFFGADQSIISAVMANLAKYTTRTTAFNRASQSDNTQPAPPETASGTPTAQPEGNISSQKLVNTSPDSTINEKELQDLAKSKRFDLARARKEGVSDEDIFSYLKQ